MLTGLLHEAFVNDTAIGRVHEPSIVVLDEEPLRDPLVHNNQRHRRRLGLVVVLCDGSLELRYLFGQADVALGIAESIPVDDEVGGEIAVVIVSEAVDGIFESLLHLLVDDLLSLLLDDVL